MRKRKRWAQSRLPGEVNVGLGVEVGQAGVGQAAGRGQAPGSIRLREQRCSGFPFAGCL